MSSLPTDLADTVEAVRRTVHARAADAERAATRYLLLVVFYAAAAISVIGLLVLAIAYLLAGQVEQPRDRDEPATADATTEGPDAEPDE